MDGEAAQLRGTRGIQGPRGGRGRRRRRRGGGGGGAAGRGRVVWGGRRRTTPGRRRGLAAVFGGPFPFEPGEEGPFAASLPPLDVFSFPPSDEERFGEYASAKNATDPTDDRSVADADLLAFLAEARVNLTPWRYWTVGGARTDPANEPANNSSTRRSSSSAWTVAPHPGSHAVRAYDAARRALALAPTHPLAAHAMVHLTESLPVANLASGPRRFDSLAAMESALSPPARGASLSPRLGADAAEALRSTFGRSTRSALVSPPRAHGRAPPRPRGRLEGRGRGVRTRRGGGSVYLRRLRRAVWRRAARSDARLRRARRRRGRRGRRAGPGSAAGNAATSRGGSRRRFTASRRSSRSLGSGGGRGSSRRRATRSGGERGRSEARGTSSRRFF